MGDIVRANVLIRGIVQGVAFRAFTEHQARRRQLRGGVRNLDDGRVEAVIEGPRGDVESLIESLRVGPPRARVDELDVTWVAPTGQDPGFSIWY